MHDATADGSGRGPGELRRVALLFLKLGTIAFGGPAAHIALMEDEVVQRRRWISRERFLDLIGATAVIPGPNSTEMTIHIGYMRAGWPGLIVAGSCFILPATIMVTAIAWAYVRYQSLPQAAGLLYGVKPVVIAVILQAAWRLGRSAIKSVTIALIGIASIAAYALGMNEIAILGAAAAAMAVIHAARFDGRAIGGTGLAAFIGGLLPGASVASAPAVGAAASAFSLSGLFLVFLKIGSVLFGSGYVLLAFLERDLVDRLGWLSTQQLIDAVAVGQVTPGPLFTTATFIGYILGGPAGAILATVGIFLPAFVFVAASGPLVPKIRQSPLAGALLDGIVIASLALMAAVAVRLGRAALIDSLTSAIAGVSAVLLFRFRVNSAWLIVGGALIGLAAATLS
jgi:chromate transporter